MSFETDSQSIFYMSNRLLKDNFDDVCVIKSQLAYICNTINSLNKHLVEFCRDVHYISWGNQ